MVRCEWIGLDVVRLLDLESEASHALPVLLNQLFALSRRVAVFFDTMSEFEETFIPRCLGVWACAASGMEEHMSFIICNERDSKVRCSRLDASRIKW